MTGPADIALEIALAGEPREGTASDVDLTERRAIFSRLVREHAAVLYGLAYRLAPSPDPTEAEDLVQEALLRAWRAFGGFRREADLRTWLYRILVNVSHDRRRSLARLFRRRPAPRPPPPDPAERMEGREVVERVLDAGTHLSRRQRECLLLRVRGNLSYREIAEVLRIREGVVKLHLVHARRKLLDRFGEEVDG